MPFRSILAAGVAALALAACASMTTPPSATLQATHGLTAAWASLDAVALVIDPLATSHVLHGPNALTAASDLTKASAALTAAGAANKAADGATAAADIAIATALISDLETIAKNP